MFGFGAADGERLLLSALAASFGGGGLFFDGDLRDEVSHLADGRLRLFLVGSIDLVPDFLPRGIHRFELISRHALRPGLFWGDKVFRCKA